MKQRFITKILALVLLTVLLSAVLTALAFGYYGRAKLSSMKAQELLPRAEFIANLTAEYLQGYVGEVDYMRAVSSEYRIWDASVYVFYANGELIVQPAGLADMNATELQGYVSTVLAGSSVYEPDTVSSAGVIIGEPAVSRYGNVLAAVFLIKPVEEVAAATNSLTISLLVSMLAVLTVMALPVYLVSRRLTTPLKQMSAVANSMAQGDFSARAEGRGSVEIAQLGQSLNHLSCELSTTIANLTFERNRIKAVMDGLREGIIACDAQGRIIQYNPAAVKLLGGEAGDDPASLLKAHGVKVPLSEDDVNSSGISVEVGEAVLSLSVALLERGDGALEGAVMLIRDVTEAIRLEQTRREYVANVSHELRTPLSCIRGLADALNDNMLDNDADKARYYANILHETMRLSRLIDDLLELSRLQSGSASIKLGRVCITDMLLEASDRFREAAKARGMEILLDMPEQRVYAHTNEDRAEQVLVALVDNAITHAADGDIRVRLARRGAKLAVSVSNNGEISKSDIAHVFDRFYKADKSHSGGGTGLGLAIAREVIAAMGESIAAASEDGVVTFTFTLSEELS